MSENHFSNESGMRLMVLPEVPGIFADAVVTNTDDALVFLSLWGRDTAIQELLARLSVSEREGGLEQLSLTRLDHPRVQIRTSNIDRYGKITGRMPKDNLFGAVTQLWLYDRLVIEPDRVNRKAIMLHLGSDGDWKSRLWQLVRQTCHLPLLDHWRDTILDAFQQQEWIEGFQGIGLNGTSINLGSDDVEPVIETLIRQGELSLVQAA